MTIDQQSSPAIHHRIVINIIIISHAIMVNNTSSCCGWSQWNASGMCRCFVVALLNAVQWPFVAVAAAADWPSLLLLHVHSPYLHPTTPRSPLPLTPALFISFLAKNKITYSTNGDDDEEDSFCSSLHLSVALFSLPSPSHRRRTH